MRSVATQYDDLHNVNFLHRAYISNSKAKLCFTIACHLHIAHTYIFSRVTTTFQKALMYALSFEESTMVASSNDNNNKALHCKCATCIQMDTSSIYVNYFRCGWKHSIVVSWVGRNKESTDIVKGSFVSMKLRGDN